MQLQLEPSFCSRPSLQHLPPSHYNTANCDPNVIITSSNNSTPHFPLTHD